VGTACLILVGKKEDREKLMSIYREVAVRILMVLSLCIGYALAPGSLLAQEIQIESPNQVGLSSVRLQRIDNLIEEAIEDEVIAGAVALVARHGRIAFMESYGMANVTDAKPMRSDTLFRIASMTKPITSLAIMMLYEEGHFFLTDPVSLFISEFKNPLILSEDSEFSESKGAITIQQLLTHTSGISYKFISNTDRRARLSQMYNDAGISDGLSETNNTIADLSTKLGELPLLFEPGSEFAYGLSIDVLGHLVEVVSDMSLTDFFENRIFKPLGMTDTHFYLPNSKLERLATLYSPGEDGRIHEVTGTIEEGYASFSPTYHHSEPQTYYSGGAGLVSTAPDYLRLLQMFLNGGELNGMRLLSPKTVQMMTRNNIGPLSVEPGIKFGLGFAIVEEPSMTGDSKSQGTYYWGGIFNTRFFVDPDEELIGIFMSQLIPRDPRRLRDRFVNTVYQAVVQ
jgi:CubicO group peptidase (beta-lactamase class C family)